MHWTVFTCLVKRWGDEPPFWVGGMAFNRAEEDCPKEWSPARLAMGAYGEQVTVTRVRLWPMMTPVEAALDEAMREARAEKDRAP